MQFDLFLRQPRRASKPGQNLQDWLAEGLIIAEKFLPYGEVMGEEFEKLPVAEPPDEHWWGLLVRRAVAARIIRKTGRYAPSERRRNHGHRYQVYIRGLE